METGLRTLLLMHPSIPGSSFDMKSLLCSILTILMLSTGVSAEEPGGQPQLPRDEQPGTETAPPPPEFVLVQKPIQELVEQARACLDDTFRIHEDRFWIILTDADYKSIEHIGRDLKAARHQFNRLCQVLGSVRPMPREKMLCIVFHDQKAFLDFYTRCESSTEALPPTAGGYFSPAKQWIVFYEPRGFPVVREAQDNLAESEDQLAEFEAEQHRDPKKAARQREIAESWSKQLDRHHEGIQAFERELRTSVTVHEAFHQLSSITGFVDSRGGWTLWLHEGFATCFETDDTAYAFGPSHESELRRNVFRSMLAKNELLPLRKLVALRTYSALPQHRLPVFYHQSYALVRWLYRFRRTQLNSYIRALRERPDLEFPRDDIKVFEEYFGPIERLERRWMRDELDDWAVSQTQP